MSSNSAPAGTVPLHVTMAVIQALASTLPADASTMANAPVDAGEPADSGPAPSPPDAAATAGPSTGTTPIVPTQINFSDILSALALMSIDVTGLPTPAAAPVTPAVNPVAAAPAAAPVTPAVNPVAAAPAAAPVVPAPTVAPVVPAPTVAPVIPAPTVAPVVPAPTVAPVVPAPTMAPVVPAPVVAAPIVPAPIVPAPVVPAPGVAPAAAAAGPANAPAGARVYCVTAGREVGVFVGWPRVKPLVSGVSNSCHQRYPSIASAQEAFDDALDRGEVTVLP
ncbi:hypothetical protein BKA70DRAFT_1437473 [Coprinopsis sp. MPI-PUGE-AT-0042]|nr:hypothetical protein BKA70DRAFT_1437473 [Coprinopsis sp. MPI-PUGE-AT-0042]